VKNFSNMPIIHEILRFTQNDNKKLIMKTVLKLAHRLKTWATICMQITMKRCLQELSDAKAV
jgi:hypothetical protein